MRKYKITDFEGQYSIKDLIEVIKRMRVDDKLEIIRVG